MNWARSILRFIWDFVVGEDWRLAAGAILALGGAALLVAFGVNAWWWVPALLALSLWTVAAR
jgi:hypothetical protein